MEAIPLYRKLCVGFMHCWLVWKVIMNMKCIETWVFATVTMHQPIWICTSHSIIPSSAVCELRSCFNISCAAFAVAWSMCVQQFACPTSFPVYIHKACSTSCFVETACLPDKLQVQKAPATAFITADTESPWLCTSLIALVSETFRIFSHRKWQYLYSILTSATCFGLLYRP
jgi:hypothetical protein